MNKTQLLENQKSHLVLRLLDGGSMVTDDLNAEVTEALFVVIGQTFEMQRHHSLHLQVDGYNVMINTAHIVTVSVRAVF